MKIETCTVEDYHEILTYLAEFWGSDRTQTLHHPMFVREFRDTALVVRDGGRIAGYLFGFVAPAEPVGYIHLVAVLEGYQRRGFARRLYRHFARIASGQGCRELKAITTPGNARSIAFHTALGMTAEGEPNALGVPVVRDYSGPGEDRVVFRMPIDPRGDQGRLFQGRDNATSSS
jgi:GNAT superfamily N-acetyltransferase